MRWRRRRFSEPARGFETGAWRAYRAAAAAVVAATACLLTGLLVPGMPAMELSSAGIFASISISRSNIFDEA